MKAKMNLDEARVGARVPMINLFVSCRESQSQRRLVANARPSGHPMAATARAFSPHSPVFRRSNSYEWSEFKKCFLFLLDANLGCRNQLISMRHSVSLQIICDLHWALPTHSPPFTGVALLPCSSSRDVITSPLQPQTPSLARGHTWQKKTLQNGSLLGEKHVGYVLV